MHLREEAVLGLPAAKKTAIPSAGLQPQGQEQNAHSDSGMSGAASDWFLICMCTAMKKEIRRGDGFAAAGA